MVPLRCRSIERAVSIEALGLLVQQAIIRAAKANRRVVSISHAVDHEDPEGKPYSALIVS